MSSSRPRPDPRRLLRLYLRTGTRSKTEVEAYLRGRGVPVTVASSLMRQAQQAGLVDDRACAKLWMRRLAEQGYAWPAIRARLHDKGLSERLIDALLSNVQRCEPDALRARALAAARLARAPSSDPRRRPRLARWLASRGFDPDLIEQVLAERVSIPVSHDD